MKLNKLKTLILAATFVVGAGAETIHARKENQQDRIASGVQSGQLTARETAHLERGEARVNRQTARDRAAHGGALTGREKTHIQREQDHLSKKIYTDKHNGAVAAH